MRKTLTLFLMLCLLCILCVGGLAADVTPSDNPNVEMTVTYGADSRYTLYIPDSIIIDPKTQTGSAELSISNVRLPANTILIFEVNSENAQDGKWYLINDNDDKVEYTIHSGLMGEVLPGDVFWCSSQVLEQGTYTETCTFRVLNTGKYASVYHDLITYTISIGYIEQNPVCYVCGGEFIWDCTECLSFESCQHVCAICPTCPACFYSETNKSPDAMIHCSYCGQCIPQYEVHRSCSYCKKCVCEPDYCSDCGLCLWCDTNH